jgi:hypothetical protein
MKKETKNFEVIDNVWGARGARDSKNDVDDR